MLKSRMLCTVCLYTVLAITAWADQAVLHMEIGDPERKNREVELRLDGITDTDTGDIITPRQLAERLADTRLLFVGETHTNLDFHNVQFKVIQELHRANREVMIGLEMFPYS
ncbi:MAG: ChaN family lipoprotein, partial [Gammaproteobacteria bacterium]|nr:ChaN family lipoprotein [Gammaproteobacteria bacterium]